MTSFKWGIIAAASALVISLLIGILSGVGASHVIVRALIFAVVFFGIGFGVRFAINSYFPEFLVAGSGADDNYNQAESEQTGSRINITMDNTGEYAVPELFKTPDDPKEMGNIDDLISGVFRAHSSGLDGGREEGYNDRSARSASSYGAHGSSAKIASEEIPYLESDTQESSDEGAPAGGAVFTPSFGDDGGLGGLPDLDMMARAFSGAGPAAARPASTQGAPASGAAPQDAVFMPSIDAEVAPESSAPRYNKGNKPEPMKGDFSPKELAEGIRSVLSKDK